MANVLRVSERASANTSEKIFVVSLTLVEVSERQRKKERKKERERVSEMKKRERKKEERGREKLPKKVFQKL